MRIITWNCRGGGFREKARHIAGYKPDILAVQEVEPLDNPTKLAGDFQPTYVHRPTFSIFPSRSTGMFSYSDTTLEAVADSDVENWGFGFRRYSVDRGPHSFQVIGIWTFDTPKDRENAYRQIHTGLKNEECREWIKSKPTMILGDFNNNASYDHNRWGELEELLDGLGFVSAYHYHFKESFGAESQPTYFHGSKVDHPFHLDYCFLPDEWAKRIRKVEVGKYDDWNQISDHVPLIVDVEL